MDKFKTVGELKEYLSSLPDETKLCSYLHDYDEYINAVYAETFDVVRMSLNGNVYYCRLENMNEPTEKVLSIGY